MISPSILRNFVLTSTAMFLSSVFSLLLYTHISQKYGVSNEVDALFMSISMTETISKILFISQFAQVFMTTFWKRYDKDKSAGWSFFLWFNVILLGLFSTLSLIFVAFAEKITLIFAAGFDHEKRTLTARIFISLMPYMFFNFFYVLFETVLQKFELFILTSLSFTAKSLSVLLISHLLDLGIFSVSVAFSLSEVLFSTFLFLCIAVRFRKEIRLKNFDGSPMIEVVKELKNYTFSNAMVFISGLSYKLTVSLLPEGSMSILQYSRKVYLFLVNIFFSAINKVMFPRFLDARGESRLLKNYLMRLSAFFASATIVLILTFALFGRTIIGLIFKLSEPVSSEINLTLLVYFLGFFFEGVMSSFGVLLIALGKNRTLSHLTAVNILIVVPSYYILSRLFGYYGVALSPTLAMILVLPFYLASIKGHLRKTTHPST